MPDGFRFEPDPERRYLVVAVNGSGKSTLVAALAPRFRTAHNLVVILDPKRDAAMRKLAPMASSQVKPRGGGMIRLVPQMDPTRKEAPCAEAADPWLAQVWNRGNCTLIIDELQMIATQNRFPPHLNLIYAQGRSRKISVLAITTEPVRIPMWVRSQSRTRIAGRVGEGGQRDYVAGLLWTDKKAFAARMDALPPYHFLLRAEEWSAQGKPAEEVWVRV